MLQSRSAYHTLSYLYFSIFFVCLSERSFSFFSRAFFIFYLSVCLSESSLEQLLHSGAEEGGLLELVRQLEDSEILGINRAVVCPEVRLRDACSTDGVVQFVPRLVLSQVLDFQIVQDVLASWTSAQSK